MPCSMLYFVAKLPRDYNLFFANAKAASSAQSSPAGGFCIMINPVVAIVNPLAGAGINIKHRIVIWQ